MLTKLQLRFIHEYLKDSNAQQAAIRAGYTPNSARKYAHTLLRKPEVQQYIGDARENFKEEAALTLEALIAEYAKVAFFDVNKLSMKRATPSPSQTCRPT